MPILENSFIHALDQAGLPFYESMNQFVRRKEIFKYQTIMNTNLQPIEYRSDFGCLDGSLTFLKRNHFIRVLI